MPAIALLHGLSLAPEKMNNRFQIIHFSRSKNGLMQIRAWEDIQGSVQIGLAAW
jgi:hypothetical protein